MKVMVIMVSRLLYLVIFLFKSYWRKTRFIIQFAILALIMGFLLNLNYAPYTYDYVVLVKNAYFIVFGLITSFHLSKLNYNREIYVLLNRVKRKWFYLSSIITSLFIVSLLGGLLDIYILLFTGLSFFELFNMRFIVYSFINLCLAIVITHLFSFYIVKAKYCILSFVLLGLGFIPNWYERLTFESVFNLLSYLVPPLGLNIIQQKAIDFSSSLLVYSSIYFLIIITIGIILIKKRSLITLK